MSATVESSVSVSVVAEAGPKVSAPRAEPPAPSRSATSPFVGSGQSAYGVGLVVPQARNTTAPEATFWPAVVATAVASVSVLPLMFVIRRVVLVTVPSAFVCGIVSV